MKHRMRARGAEQSPERLPDDACERRLVTDYFLMRSAVAMRSTGTPTTP